MTKFIVVLGILAVLMGIGYYAFFYSPTKPDVTLGIRVPDQVLVGEPFEVVLSYSNHSSDSLENSKISLSLPQNVSVLGKSEDIKVNEIPLGALSPGKTGEEKVQLIVLDDPQTVKRLTAKISYSLENIQTSFETNAKADVVVGSSAATLQFTAPDTVVSGQVFEIDLHYKNNSGKDFQNAKIHIDYPPIYSVAQSDPQTSTGKNEWNLGVLAANAEGNIKIKGSAVGPDGTTLNYTVRFISNVGSQSYELQHQVAGINISKSPLTVTVQINGNNNYVAKTGDALRYVISYKNNSETALRDANIKASLSGQLFDLQGLRTDGVLNSVNNTISWSGANKADLKNIAPGASGQVEFEVGVLTPTIRRLSDKNYILKVTAQMQSPTVPSGIQASETISAAVLETKLQGMARLSQEAYRYDTSLGSQNTGPYPPKANQKTQYTIHWKIANYYTDVSSIKVVAVLQSGTVWTGKVGKTDYPPKYDSRTGTITWEIPRIPATVGVLGAPQELIFQVENTPALNQVGQNVTLVSEANLTAMDDFAKVTLDSTAPAADTSLPYDTKITVNDRRVQN